jgi:hypothetical protein
MVRIAFAGKYVPHDLGIEAYYAVYPDEALKLREHGRKR